MHFLHFVSFLGTFAVFGISITSACSFDNCLKDVFPKLSFNEIDQPGVCGKMEDAKNCMEKIETNCSSPDIDQGTAKSFREMKEALTSLYKVCSNPSSANLTEPCDVPAMDECSYDVPGYDVDKKATCLSVGKYHKCQKEVKDICRESFIFKIFKILSFKYEKVEEHCEKEGYQTSPDNGVSVKPSVIMILTFMAGTLLCFV